MGWFSSDTSELEKKVEELERKVENLIRFCKPLGKKYFKENALRYCQKHIEFISNDPTFSYSQYFMTSLCGKHFLIIQDDNTVKNVNFRMFDIVYKKSLGGYCWCMYDGFEWVSVDYIYSVLTRAEHESNSGV